MRLTSLPAAFICAIFWILLASPASSQIPVRVGAELQLNTYTTGDQRQVQVSATPGGFIVVWEGESAQDSTQNNSVPGLTGLRLGPDGSAVGQEFQVNSYTPGIQNDASVGADANGNFVVVWASYGSSGVDDYYSIQGQRFASDGSPIASQFQVNTYTTGVQNESAVAVAPAGDFLVTWHSSLSAGTDSSSDSVHGRFFASDGQAVGDDFQINTTTTSGQLNPAVTADGAGRFVVVWDSNSSSGTDSSGQSIQLQRFASDGVPIGAEVQVNSYTTGFQLVPEVAAAPDGSFVVAWLGQSLPGDVDQTIVARRFGSTGSPIGDDFLVNTDTTGIQDSPSVHVAEDGGFFILWRSAGIDIGDTSGSSIQGQRFAPDGTAIDGQFQVNTYTTSFQNLPVVAGDGSGDFVALWHGGSAGTDTDGDSVKAQFFRVTGDVGGRIWRDTDGDGVQDPGEPDLPGVTVELFDLFDSSVAQTTSGVDGRYLFKVEGNVYTVRVTHPANFSFSPQDQGDDTTDSDVDAFGDSPTFKLGNGVTFPDIDAGLIPSYEVGDRVWRDQNGNGVQDAGEPGVANVIVTLFTEEGRETAQTTTDSQGLYSLRADSASYYLEFTSPAGEVFSPRDVGGDDTLDSDAALDGRTIVFDLDVPDTSWDAGLLPMPSAVAAGDDFQVNSFTENLQNLSSIAMDEDGNFVIVYRSRDEGTSPGIRGQRYDPAGSAIGSEFIANTYTTGSQIFPDVSMAGSGEFVVVWRSLGSFGNDTDGLSIQGQRFASDGSLLGGQFQVNTYTTGSDYQPKVAMDDSGAFVVAWSSYQSNNGDGDGLGIQARRFAPDGSAIGNSFLVNEITGGDQSRVDIAADTQGFVVTWMSDESIALTHGHGDESSGTVLFDDNDPPSIRARRFASDGSPIGSQFQVNDYVTSGQRNPSVVLLESGDFIIAFESDGSSQGDSDGSVLMRRFDSGGSAIGGELQVNTFTTSSQSYPRVAAAPSGDFLVVWTSDGAADGVDNDRVSIQGQRFSAAAQRIDSQFTVNSLTSGAQSTSAVAMDPWGDFAVSWTQGDPTATDSSPTSVRARRFRTTGALGGRVFTDSDGDGVQDVGESGVPGVGVDLLDADGALLASVTTESEGHYRFGKIPQGDYTLRIPLLPGQYTGFTSQNVGSDATDSDFDASGRTALIRVDAAEVDLDQDAGVLANRIGDRVWLDSNLNGRQDGGEPGFGGVTVELFTLTGLSQGQVITASDGSYAFEAVTPGSYFLAFSEPEGFCYTAQDQGDDTGDSDVDPATFTTGEIFVTAAQSELGWDAGLVPDASIGNRVWLDNGNGIQDVGEEGVQGVTVRLFDDQDTFLGSTNTDGDGLYRFDPGPGDYYLEVVVPGEMAFAPRDQGVNDAVDSDVNAASGTTSVFVLEPGAVDATRDAGLEPATIGNRVWIDLDRDGRQQPSEPGLGGVAVRLLNAAGDEIASTVTDADGVYGFLGIASGLYRLEVALPAEAVFSSQDAGDDDLVDSDVDPLTGLTAIFTYGAGSASRSHDAGVYFQPFFADNFESGDASRWSATHP